MKKKWITKAEIAAILKMYSIKKDEFEFIGQTGYSYQSRYVKGYVLTLDEEIQYGNIKTGRIIVSHTQGNGKRTFQDIWDHDKEGKLLFCFRNLWNQPFSDVDHIRNLEQQVQTLKTAGQELQEKLQGLSNPEKEYGTGQQSYHKLIEENKRLQERIDFLTTENQKLCRHNVRGAGRKPDFQRLTSQAKRVQELLEDGKTATEIQETMGISKSTFYRYKRNIHFSI